MLVRYSSLTLFHTKQKRKDSLVHEASRVMQIQRKDRTPKEFSFEIEFLNTGSQLSINYVLDTQIINFRSNYSLA